MQRAMEDPKIYILLNKTFRRVIKKLQDKKKSKNDVLSNRISLRKPLTISKAESEITSLNGYQKIQYGLWAYSALEGSKVSQLMVKLYKIKPRTTEEEE